MDSRTLIGALAAGRVALGAGLTLTPGLITRIWVGEHSPATRVLSAGFGARDVAIGAGTLRALSSGESVRPWLLAGALSDALDLTATFAARRSLPKLGVLATCTVAAAGTAAGLWAASRDPQPLP